MKEEEYSECCHMNWESIEPLGSASMTRVSLGSVYVIWGGIQEKGYSWEQFLRQIPLWG